MEEMEQDTKQCPFCGGEIKKVAIKCRHCGKFLNEDSVQKTNETISVNISDTAKYLKGLLLCVLGIGIAVLLIWILFHDSPSVIRNKENFWYGQYLSAGQLHALLLIWLTQVFIAVKK
jgi:hypothetical protein